MKDDDSTDGTVTQDGRHAVIRFERHLPYRVDEVWPALTEPARALQWWGDLDIDPRPGGRFNLTWLNPTPDGDRLTMHATVTVFDPPRLLETSGDTHGVLRWELSPQDGGTVLVFTSALDLPDEFRTRVWPAGTSTCSPSATPSAVGRWIWPNSPNGMPSTTATWPGTAEPHA